MDDDFKVNDGKPEDQKPEAFKPVDAPKDVERREDGEHEHGTEASGLDGALDSTRKATSVHESVRVMADRLAQLFTDAAIEGPDAAEKLAIRLREREGEFADAVRENAAELLQGGAPMGVPRAGAGDFKAVADAQHSEPHNPAAAAAVAAGMDTKTANLMTQQGSNS